MNDMKPQSRNERGQTLVEFVLIMPMVLMFCFMVFDVGRAVYYNSVLKNAAREGARYGAVLPADTVGIEAAVQKHAYGLNPGAIAITTLDTGTTTNTIVVHVSYDFLPATPLVAGLLPGQHLFLNSQATMRIER